MKNEATLVEIKRAIYKKSSQIIRGALSATDGAADKGDIAKYEQAKALFESAWADHCAEIEAKLYSSPALG